MKISKSGKILPTDKRLRLGIWGLGRGLHISQICSQLNIEVVAGCDYNQHMREQFLRVYPRAWVTDSAEEFLAGDYEAVLLATYCPAHADDAIACLKSGKHILSEVTAFHTLAEGVRLVEAVEKSGLVYNLAENYPFSQANMWLARRWREGLFGELMYAEYEYVHECRMLAYVYIDGTPVQPGWTVHNWRSWLNFHYYNTHSLGPVMYITGTRPVRVVALPGRQKLAGYPMKGTQGMGGVTPSLLSLDNGAIMRNLMGATTNDSHIQRLWGTKGSAEIIDGQLRLRLGGAGGSPKWEVLPKWEELAEYAEKAGHGGGDFWVLYYFVRQILTGEPAPFDIYKAADCTLPGILAYRSAQDNGKPYDVPDFRKKSHRDKYRQDNFACPRYKVEKGCFPKNADKKLTSEFTTIMRNLIHYACLYRAYADWSAVIDRMVEPKEVLGLADQLINHYREMQNTFKQARKLADTYPESDGARVINELLALADEPYTTHPKFLSALKNQRTKLAKKIKHNDLPIFCLDE